jgi:hypothetical protein
LRGAHLGEDLVGVGLRVNAEIHSQRHLTVAGVQRVHIVHVVDPRHLLFNGGRHGLRDCLGISASEVADDLDLRVGNTGELGDRKPQHRDDASDDHQDRNNDRHDWPVDKELRHRQLLSFTDATTYGLVLTGVPCRTFMKPSTITFSPGFIPSVMIQSFPTRSPTLT